MPHIGNFNMKDDGFYGRIRTLTLDADICIVVAEPSDHENAPDYRIHLGTDHKGPEIGAGWKHESEKAGAFVAVQIDDPAFAQPLRANLFQSNSDKAAHVLLWNRTPKREES